MTRQAKKPTEPEVQQPEAERPEVVETDKAVPTTSSKKPQGEVPIFSEEDLNQARATIKKWWELKVPVLNLHDYHWMLRDNLTVRRTQKKDMNCVFLKAQDKSSSGSSMDSIGAIFDYGKAPCGNFLTFGVLGRDGKISRAEVPTGLFDWGKTASHQAKDDYCAAITELPEHDTYNVSTNLEIR